MDKEQGAIFEPPISEKRGGAMGALDAEAKQYLGKRKTFADAFNYLLYDGEQVIDPENLKEMDTAQLALPYGNNARIPVQKYRDLLKIWEAMTDGNAIYVILGAELQGKVHYAMPVKDGLYDLIGYSNQVEENRRSLKNKDKKESSDETAELYAEDGVLKIKLTSEEFLSGFRKEDRLIPIITAVIYVGSEPWDGPKSLLEMMDIRDNRIIPFLNDYKLNIISVAEIADSDFDKFNTVLGKVLKIVKHQKEDADKLIEELGHTKIDPDVAFFLKKAANLDIEIEVKDGGVDMCESLERKYKEKEVTGAIEGMRLMGASDNDIVTKIVERFNVTKEYVMALLAPKLV